MTPSEAVLARALAPANLSSAQWSAVQAGLRDRAFFSAKVEEARVLHAMREATAGVAAGSLSASDARLAIRKALAEIGYKPPAGKEGGLQDHTSDARLNLILKTNADMARGYVQHCESMAALDAFPAQELIRFEAREKPRDWHARWRAAGGRFVGGGRMIALKTDPIWTRISRFGHPWPPFDFGSGMGVLDIDRAEALALGLLRPAGNGGETPGAPPGTLPESFNAGLGEALPPGREKETDLFLRDTFGSFITIRDDRAIWNGTLIRDMLAGSPDTPNAIFGKAEKQPKLLSKIAEPDMAEHLKKSGLTITREWMQTHAQKHANPSGKGGANLPLSPADFELLPALWRAPDRATFDGPHRLNLELDTLDGGILFLGIDPFEGRPKTFYKFKK